MTVNASVPFDALREIRDQALLLNLGRAYLCEGPFLMKYGGELERALQFLGRDIDGLKKQFPGKSAQDVDTDHLVQGMEALIQRLKTPNKALEEECTVGRLAQDLEDHLQGLSNAINKIRSRVEGGPATYTSTEAVSAAVTRAGDMARSGLGMAARVILGVLIVLVAAFAYLFLTMERKSPHEEVIARCAQQIQVHQEELALLAVQIRPLEERIMDVQRQASTRADKIRGMELRVQLQELEQKARSFQGKIEMEERRMEEAREALRALEDKDFLQRLLRQ